MRCRAAVEGQREQKVEVLLDSEREGSRRCGERCSGKWEEGRERKRERVQSGSRNRKVQEEGGIRFMQMNVRNTLNGTSCIGIKTEPSRRGPCSFAVPVPSGFYPLLNASAKNQLFLRISVYVSRRDRV